MAQDNLIYSKKVKQNSWIYTLFLFISFVWVSVYPSLCSYIDSFQYGFGNVLSPNNLQVVIAGIFSEALVNWIVFEIMFWIYRYVLSFKIYTFIVPMDSFKAETRIYFIFRNVILGVIYNLCFLFPYLYIYSLFFELVVTLLVLISYAEHLNHRYSETIVGHFVFKNFCYPIFIYEGIEILFQLWLVLL